MAKSWDEYCQVQKLVADPKEGVANFGPWRVKPGGLMVSRSFGDADSKLKDRGGVVGGIVSEPEIFQTQVTEETDFVLMGTAGIFEWVSGEDCISTAWEQFHSWKRNRRQNPSSCPPFKDCLSHTVNIILNKCIARQSEENLTLLLILFTPFSKHLE